MKLGMAVSIGEGRLIAVIDCRPVLDGNSSRIVPNGNGYADAMPGDRSSCQSILSPVSQVLKRGTGPPHVYLGFSKPIVDLLVYLCRVSSEEGLDLHHWSQPEKSPDEA